MSFSAKHIERLVRRAFLRSLRTLPGRRSQRRGNSQDLSSLSSPRILLLRPDRIGDAIISVPVIRLLRKHFPGARIDMLLGEKNRSAAPLLPGLDATYVIPASPLKIPGVLRRLRACRYDVVINLLAKDSASGAALSGLAGGRFRIGFQGESASVYDAAVPLPREPVHIVRSTSLLLQPLGITPIGEVPERPEDRLVITVQKEAREKARGIMNALRPAPPNPIVIMNVSGSSPEKFLGVERYVETARLLREQGISPLFAGAPGDRHLLDAIAAASGCVALPTTGSLMEFAALLDEADLVSTPDTSIVHIAAALGKPTVAIVPSGGTGAAWGPWGVSHRIVSGSGTMNDITPAALAASIISLVSATAGAFPASSAS